jgi:hypothetical protein
LYHRLVSIGITTSASSSSASSTFEPESQSADTAAKISESFDSESASTLAVQPEESKVDDEKQNHSTTTDESVAKFTSTPTSSLYLTPAQRAKLESLHTHSLFYLAQACQHLGEIDAVC